MMKAPSLLAFMPVSVSEHTFSYDLKEDTCADR